MDESGSTIKDHSGSRSLWWQRNFAAFLSIPACHSPLPHKMHPIFLITGLAGVHY